MRKFLVTTVLVFTTAILFAQDEIFKAAWVTNPVKVDGNGDEWTNPLRYYDADTKLSFAFTNDDKNLYLCFETNDNLNQIKIMHAGMEISLNIKGGRTATINFPMPENNEQPRQQNEMNAAKDRFDSGKANTSRVEKNTMELKGFSTKNGIIPTNDSAGIHAAVNADPRNKFTCEIAIPLKELFGINYSTSDIAKHISLEVAINAMKGISRSAKTSAVNNNYAAKNRGGGRAGGGMHHNGGNNSAGENTGELKEDKTEMSKKTSFKQKFMLAQKP